MWPQRQQLDGGYEQVIDQIIATAKELTRCCAEITAYADKINKLQGAKGKPQNVSKIDIHIKGQGGGTITVEAQPTPEVLNTLLEAEIARLYQQLAAACTANIHRASSVRDCCKEVIEPKGPDDPTRKIRT